MDTHNAVYWIDRLEMLPHPEGGYYKETFKSAAKINRVSDGKTKDAVTSIYYLLEGNDHSAFHRILSDEIWYFHKGAPLNIYVISDDGALKIHELSDAETGDLSLVVPAGLWFAAELKSKQDFSLVSCAVAPGFDFEEFELADSETLSAEYPEYQALIKRLGQH